MLPLLVWHLHGGKGRRERKRGFSGGYQSSQDHIFSSRKEKKEGQVNIRMEVRTKEKRKRESVTAGVQCSYQTVYVCWRVTRHMACSCPTSSTQKFFFAPLVFLLFFKFFFPTRERRGVKDGSPSHNSLQMRLFAEVLTHSTGCPADAMLAKGSAAGGSLVASTLLHKIGASVPKNTPQFYCFFFPSSRPSGVAPWVFEQCSANAVLISSRVGLLPGLCNTHNFGIRTHW